MHECGLPRVLPRSAGVTSGDFEEEDLPRAGIVLPIIQGSAHRYVRLEGARLGVSQALRCHRAGLLSRVQYVAPHGLVAAGLQQPHLENSDS